MFPSGGLSVYTCRAGTRTLSLSRYPHLLRIPGTRRAVPSRKADVSQPPGSHDSQLPGAGHLDLGSQVRGCSCRARGRCRAPVHTGSVYPLGEPSPAVADCSPLLRPAVLPASGASGPVCSVFSTSPVAAGGRCCGLAPHSRRGVNIPPFMAWLTLPRSQHRDFLMAPWFTSCSVLMALVGLSRALAHMTVPALSRRPVSLLCVMDSPVMRPVATSSYS